VFVGDAFPNCNGSSAFSARMAVGSVKVKILDGIFSEPRYTASAPTAQKTSHAAAIVGWRLTATEMCSTLRCVATSEARRGEERLLFLLLRALPSNEQQTLVLPRHSSIVACLYRFLWLNSYCFGQISHNTLL
jgi:hypothetical protein